MKVTPENWEAMLAQNRVMIHFLTLLADEDRAGTHYLLGELSSKEWVQLIFGLATTLEGMLAYIAYQEGHTLREQIQLLALNIQSMTAEEAQERINKWRQGHGIS